MYIWLRYGRTSLYQTGSTKEVVEGFTIYAQYIKHTIFIHIQDVAPLHL